MGTVHGLLKRLSGIDANKQGTTALRSKIVQNIREYVKQKFMADIVRLQQDPSKSTVRFLFNRMLILDAFVNICHRDFLDNQFDDARLVSLLSICTRGNKQHDTTINSQQTVVKLVPFEFRFGKWPGCLLYELLCDPKNKKSAHGMYNKGLLSSNRFTMWSQGVHTQQKLANDVKLARDDEKQKQFRVVQALEADIETQKSNVQHLTRENLRLQDDLDLYLGYQKRIQNPKSANRSQPTSQQSPRL